MPALFKVTHFPTHIAFILCQQCTFCFHSMRQQNAVNVNVSLAILSKAVVLFNISSLDGLSAAYVSVNRRSLSET